MPTLPTQASTPSFRRLGVLALIAFVVSLWWTSPVRPQVPPRSLGEAIDDQIAWVQSRPDDAAALKDLGNLYALAGLHERAEEAYRESMRFAPEDAGAPFNLALLLLEGEPREAQKLLQHAIALDPELAWAHYTLGTVHQRKGRRGAAIAAFARAFRLDPELALSDRNPHVIGNPDAIAALLKADPQQELDRTTPREFAEPGRIAALLIAQGAPVETTPSAGPASSTTPSAGDTGPASTGATAPTPGDPAAGATPTAPEGREARATSATPPASTPVTPGQPLPAERSVPPSPNEREGARRVVSAPRPPETATPPPAPSATAPQAETPETSTPREDLFSQDNASAAPRVRPRGDGA